MSAANEPRRLWCVCALSRAVRPHARRAGVFALKVAECILMNSPMDFTQADMEYFRIEIGFQIAANRFRREGDADAAGHGAFATI